MHVPRSSLNGVVGCVRLGICGVRRAALHDILDADCHEAVVLLLPLDIQVAGHRVAGCARDGRLQEEHLLPPVRGSRGVWARGQNHLCNNSASHVVHWATVEWARAVINTRLRGGASSAPPTDDILRRSHTQC